VVLTGWERPMNFAENILLGQDEKKPGLKAAQFPIRVERIVRQY